MRATLFLVLILALPLSLGAAEVVTLDAAAEPLSVRVIESDSERTVLEYEIGSFAKSPVDIDGETYYLIGLGDESRRLEKGLPELPNVRRSIVIPDAAEMGLRVVSSHYVDFTDVAVAPSKGVLLRNVDPATVQRTFDAFYDLDEWYPANLATSDDPYIMRDCRGLVVELNPIQYNPATRTLRVYDSVVLEVAQVGPGRTNVLARRPSTTMNAEFRKIYERHFINFSDTRLARYSSVGEVGNMLVICYVSYMSSMQPLVDWKNQMGVPCEMVSVADAGSSASGIDAYIQSYYDTNGLAFVLLVGDAAQCPSLAASGGASDPSYSLVAGSDFYPDIFVGRFSAESSSMVETQVERTVEYEKLPQSGGTWYHRGFGVASNQGAGIGDDGEADDVHMDNIRGDLLAFTYTDVDQIYDPSGTASQVSSALNDGRSVGNYCGHGSVTSWVSTGFSNTHVNALTNDNMLPFIISVACVNGDFDGYTCFAEAWLRATDGGEPTGAVGFYGSSINQSWAPPMAAQDESDDLLVAGAKRTFGGLCFNGSCLMMDEYGSDGQNMFLTWNVFGDPSLRVRTDTPAGLLVSHAADVAPDATSFGVTVTGVSGALCALYYNGVLYGSAFTDGSSSATIPLAGSLPDGVDLVLTVTSFNAMPYFGTVNVSEPYYTEISIDPAFFDMTLEPGGIDTDMLTISNVGEALSTLNYDIEIVDATPRRSLTGSTLTAAPAEYAPGTTETFTFSMYNGSTDTEWIDSASLDFPPGVTVNSCTDFVVSASGHTMPWDGQTGYGAAVTWTYTSGTWGIIYDGETATSDISLTVDSGFTGPIEVAYTLYGDIYGADPHTVSGTVTIDPPAGPTVTLTAPNGGENWGIGETHDVTWTWTGTFANVQITCSSDGGSTWWAIIGATPNDGSYAWTVDGPVSDNCLVRVMAVGDPSVLDTSNAIFSMYQPVTWLTASPLSGAIPGGGSQPVELTFDATGLSDGDYYANLNIGSNGGGVTVPVTLHVQTSGVVNPWPDAMVLYGNYPNPFNPTTKLAFALPAKQRVRVDVYDISGRHVKTVADQVFDGGGNEVVWDGANDAGQTVASGVYIFRIESGDASRSAKMVLTK